MLLQHDEVTYDVAMDPVAKTATYRVYLCKEVGSEKQYMLQIARSANDNGSLMKAAYVLETLRQTAEEFEVEHAEQGGDKLLSYERLFPEVVAGFTVAEQGGRRVNILAFAEVDNPEILVPLSGLAAKDHLRVSLTSSAWIMGRLLKLLGLAHGEGIEVKALGAKNILLEPSQHFAIVFDWSSSQTYQEGIPSRQRKADIQTAAKTVFTAIGGDPQSGEFTYQADERDRRYVKFLWDLTSSRQSNANEAHDQFYELIDELWGREFRKFTTLPL